VNVASGVFVAIWVVAQAASAGETTRSVTGQMGLLAEWDLTATVTAAPDGGGKRWSGPLSLKHVGFCSADGPEEKLGEVRLVLSDRPGEAAVTLVIDGATCAFKGHLGDAYGGMMTCPDRRDIPMTLTIE
jgi:hypothetical protein